MGLVKVALLFLLVMAALGVIGRFRRRGGGGAGAARCAACGRPRVGRGPCPCGRA